MKSPGSQTSLKKSQLISVHQQKRNHQGAPIGNLSSHRKLRRMNYFVTAIGTDSGKTLACAILCKALAADYWKPVQAGYPTDSETVRFLLADAPSKIHKEAYIFKTP